MGNKVGKYMNRTALQALRLARPARRLACFLFAAVFTAEAAAAELPDVSDPKIAMETWMRLKGDLAGGVTYEWAPDWEAG